MGLWQFYKYCFTSFGMRGVVVLLTIMYMIAFLIYRFIDIDNAFVIYYVLVHIYALGSILPVAFYSIHPAFFDSLINGKKKENGEVDLSVECGISCWWIFFHFGAQAPFFFRLLKDKIKRELIWKLTVIAIPFVALFIIIFFPIMYDTDYDDVIYSVLLFLYLYLHIYYAFIGCLSYIKNHLTYGRPVGEISWKGKYHLHWLFNPFTYFAYCIAIPLIPILQWMLWFIQINPQPQKRRILEGMKVAVDEPFEDPAEQSNEVFELSIDEKVDEIHEWVYDPEIDQEYENLYASYSMQVKENIDPDILPPGQQGENVCSECKQALLDGQNILVPECYHIYHYPCLMNRYDFDKEWRDCGEKIELYEKVKVEEPGPKRKPTLTMRQRLNFAANIRIRKVANIGPKLQGQVRPQIDPERPRRLLEEAKKNTVAQPHYYVPGELVGPKKSEIQPRILKINRGMRKGAYFAAGFKS